jgi:vancomycin resistance protein VanW
MLLSERYQMVYYLRVTQKRLMRHLVWLTDGKHYCRQKNNVTLPYIVKKHRSVLVRRLGEPDIRLQYNKIINLKIAAAKIDGMLIRPEETFSFWKTVGKTSRRKGYREGMFLSGGNVKVGIGGGLCQLSNLLYWMVLHTPLTITERYRHSFDPFPDCGRVLPFGSGATVFFNYIDLQFTNNTQLVFQIKIFFDDKFIKGEIFADSSLPVAYHILEKEHRFLKKDNKVYRENELWRVTINKKTGEQIMEEMILKNHCEVKYPCTPSIVT